MVSKATVIMFVGTVLATSHAVAQSPEGLKQLKNEIKAVRASQAAIQKELAIIRGILSGKRPPLENVSIDVSASQSIGDIGANVAIVEFSDFQCRFCASYVNQTFPKILGEYVKTGKVRYVVRDFPLEENHLMASKAAESARCAGDQGKFWEMRQSLFGNPQSLNETAILTQAGGIGLSMQQFHECLETGRYSAAVRKDIEEGQVLGVAGTPSFFVGTFDDKDRSRVAAVSMLSGAQPFNSFKEALDALLSLAGKRKQKGGS